MIQPDDGLTIGDAFGAALKDSFERNPHGMRVHVIERDDGFIDTADTAQYFAPPEEWSALDRWALDGVARRVLEISATERAGTRWSIDDVREDGLLYAVRMALE